MGWSICSCILGSVLAVLGWRYWAGGGPGGVKAVTGEGVGAVTVGSNCWAGCGGLYKLSCHSSLALVNKGEASRAYTDGACAGKTCTDGACADRACVDRACAGRAFADGACAGGAYAGRACMDGARDIVYSKSPISPGNGGFVSIKGPKRLEI